MVTHSGYFVLSRLQVSHKRTKIHENPRKSTTIRHNRTSIRILSVRNSSERDDRGESLNLSSARPVAKLLNFYRGRPIRDRPPPSPLSLLPSANQLESGDSTAIVTTMNIRFYFQRFPSDRSDHSLVPPPAEYSRLKYSPSKYSR